MTTAGKGPLPWGRVSVPASFTPGALDTVTSSVR